MQGSNQALDPRKEHAPKVPVETTLVVRPAWRSMVVKFLRAAALLTILYFVSRELWRRLSVIDWSEVQVSWPWVVLALLLSTIASGLPVVSVKFALRSFTPRVPDWVPLAAVSWLPSLGKYVPGKIISVAGGFWMLKMLQVSTLAAGIAVFVLNGLSVMIGLLMSLPLAWWQPVREKVPALGPMGMLLLAVGCICLHPRVIGTIVTFCLRKLKRTQQAYVPRWNDYGVPMATIALQFLLQGISLWTLSNAFETIPVSWLPAFISINALAISVGFLALFAPGGIGVREGILLLVLSPATTSAALIVIAMRTISLTGELILGGIGALIFCSPVWKRACERAKAESELEAGLEENAPPTAGQESASPASQAA